MPQAIKKSFTYGAHTVTLETGEISRQASGAVISAAIPVIAVAFISAFLLVLRFKHHKHD